MLLYIARLYGLNALYNMMVVYVLLSNHVQKLDFINELHGCTILSFKSKTPSSSDLACHLVH